MNCPNCKEKMVESNLNHNMDRDDEYYWERYFCFGCGALYECNSLSGDMTEENMEFIGEVM